MNILTTGLEIPEFRFAASGMTTKNKDVIPAEFAGGGQGTNAGISCLCKD